MGERGRRDVPPRQHLARPAFSASPPGIESAALSAQVALPIGACSAARVAAPLRNWRALTYLERVRPLPQDAFTLTPTRDSYDPQPMRSYTVGVQTVRRRAFIWRLA